MQFILSRLSFLIICTQLLQDQTHEKWETRYVLLHWLATLCLIPFDICSMDSLAGSESSTKSALVINIVRTCKMYLGDTGPTREAAATCLSYLLTRPDMEDGHLRDFMTWAIELLTAWSALPDAERSCLSAAYFNVLGVLKCLFQIFKLGHRFKLLPYGPLLLPFCLNLSDGISQTSTRKLLTKLIQRIGMNFLPPRIASWRYMRGSRSLNLASKLPSKVGAARSIATGSVPGAVEAEDEAADEVPEEMEDVLDRLLTALGDKDTVVRWSAAKGIGRITMRLTQEHASDVVDAVIASFCDKEADSSWHGGCLALAELSRRGLLLPDRLREVIPFVERAIQYDILRGQHSIGAHVRDAACYVCWAFSRAYSPAVMAPFLEALSTALLVTALFDREVNCRRAASAAYQETVGRQGNQNVPLGIEIITIADYFSVGNRASCFAVLAAKVASLDAKLCKPFVAHLATVTVKHWDADMRALAASALASFVPINHAATLQHLGALVASCTSQNLNLRHGSLLAVSELLFALSAEFVVISEPTVASIKEVVPAIEKARLYRGRGGELVREAVCALISSIARSKVALSVKLQVAYVESLNEHLRQPHDSVQCAARDALREFLFSYFSSGEAPSERLQKLTVLKYMDGILHDSNASVTRGYALAMGVLPMRLLVHPEGRVDEVLACLRRACSTELLVCGEYDANTCCNAVASLIELAERLCESNRFTVAQLDTCFQILYRASEDYSVDKRGDTGSWSRIIAMKGMERLVYAWLRRICWNERKDTVSAASPSLPGSVDTGALVAGSRVETSEGFSIVSSVVAKKEGHSVLQVDLPSAGQGAAARVHSRLYMKDEHRCGAACDLLFAGPHVESEDRKEAVSFLRTTLPPVFCTVLKQLAEKLDSVREVAGAVLLRLLFHCMDTELPAAGNVAFEMVPGAALIAALIRKHTDSGPENKPDGSGINWARPSHVYPIICSVMDSDTYFVPILSGLVLSSGGLSESTAKISAQSLIAYCRHAKEGRPSRLRDLANAFVGILRNYKRTDRVTVPCVKTLVLVLNEGVLDELDPAFLFQFASDLCTVLEAEARGSTSIVKLSAVLDLLLRVLSMDVGRARCDLLLAVLVMLTHKYPRIRKCKHNMVSACLPCVVNFDISCELFVLQSLYRLRRVFVCAALVRYPRCGQQA